MLIPNYLFHTEEQSRPEYNTSLLIRFLFDSGLIQVKQTTSNGFSANPESKPNRIRLQQRKPRS